MFLFDRTLERAVEIQARIIDRMEKQLYHCMRQLKCKPNPVRWALITIINNSKFIIMDLILNENQFTIGQNGLFDTKDGHQYADAVFSNVQFDNPDPSIATIQVLPDGTVKVQAVPDQDDTPSRPILLNGLADVAYTNSLGESSNGSVVLKLSLTVLAVQTADGVEWRIQFGAPQQNP